jgi:hypothetical protein
MRLLVATLAALLAVFATVGCGDTVLDDVETEALVEGYVEASLQKKVSAVECPSGVEVEKGATLDCEVTLTGGERETATVEILNEDADIGVADLKAKK